MAFGKGMNPAIVRGVVYGGRLKVDIYVSLE